MGNFEVVQESEKYYGSLRLGVISNTEAKGITQFSITALHANRPLVKIIWPLIIISIVVIIITLSVCSTVDNDTDWQKDRYTTITTPAYTALA